jgi:hypothetical protein
MLKRGRAALLYSALALCSAVVASSANAGVIFWDVSKGVGDNYSPSGRYSVLVNHLAPRGHSFTEGAQSLDQAPLSNFDVLVIASQSSYSNSYSAAELDRVEHLVRVEGKGLLLLSEVYGASGWAKVRQVAQRFGADLATYRFPTDDVNSTIVHPHPSTAGVFSIYERYSSPVFPGSELAPYAFNGSHVMLAAGNVGNGRVVLIADGDLFTYAPGPITYFDRAQNRQLADSTFDYLVPEPGSACSVAAIALWAIGSRSRKR